MCNLWGPGSTATELESRMSKKKEPAVLIAIISVNPLPLEVGGVIDQPVATVISEVGIEGNPPEQGDRDGLEDPVDSMAALMNL
jgi:hypothetical protein